MSLAHSYFGSAYIGQHNAMEIFDLKWNVVSKTSKVLLNDIFTERDRSSGIKNILIKSWRIAGRLYFTKN